jgi:hypothetical protein
MAMSLLAEMMHNASAFKGLQSDSDEEGAEQTGGRGEPAAAGGGFDKEEKPKFGCPPEPSFAASRFFGQPLQDDFEITSGEEPSELTTIASALGRWCYTAEPVDQKGLIIKKGVDLTVGDAFFHDGQWEKGEAEGFTFVIAACRKATNDKRGRSAPPRPLPSA